MNTQRAETSCFVTAAHSCSDVERREGMANSKTDDHAHSSLNRFNIQYLYLHTDKLQSLVYM